MNVKRLLQRVSCDAGLPGCPSPNLDQRHSVENLFRGVALFLPFRCNKERANGSKGRHKAKPENRSILAAKCQIRRRPARRGKARLTTFNPPLQKPSRNVPKSGRLDNEQPELGGALFELTNLLLTMAFLVVLHPLVDVLVAPAEHAIDEDGKLMGHGGNRFRGAEFAAEATVLSAEVALAAKQGGGGDPEGGGRAIDHVAGAAADHFPAGDAIIWT